MTEPHTPPAGPNPAIQALLAQHFAQVPPSLLGAYTAARGDEIAPNASNVFDEAGAATAIERPALQRLKRNDSLGRNTGRTALRTSFDGKVQMRRRVSADNNAGVTDVDAKTPIRDHEDVPGHDGRSYRHTRRPSGGRQIPDRLVGPLISDLTKQLTEVTNLLESLYSAARSAHDSLQQTLNGAGPSDDPKHQQVVTSKTARFGKAFTTYWKRACVALVDELKGQEQPAELDEAHRIVTAYKTAMDARIRAAIQRLGELVEVDADGKALRRSSGASLSGTYEELHRVSRGLADALAELGNERKTKSVAPTMAGAMAVGGKVFGSTSQKREYLTLVHPLIRGLLDQIPAEWRSSGHGNCAEMTVLSDYVHAWITENETRLDLGNDVALRQTLLTHFERAGATTISHYFNDAVGVYGVPACESCRYVLTRLGIMWVESHDILTPPERERAINAPAELDADGEPVDPIAAAERRKMLDTTMTKYVWRGHEEGVEDESVAQAWQTLQAMSDPHDTDPHEKARDILETPREQRPGPS